MDRTADMCHLELRELGMHGKRDDFLRSALGNWKVSLSLACHGKRFLQVKRDRVVDPMGNFLFGKECGK